jgi:hypothetical protein
LLVLLKPRSIDESAWGVMLACAALSNARCMSGTVMPSIWLNLGLAVALHPQIDDLPIAAGVPVKGAKIVHDRRSLRPGSLTRLAFAGACADRRFDGGRYLRKP